MDSLEALRHKLEEQAVEYEILTHKYTARTAQEGAAMLGIELGQTAPALIVKSPDVYLALIVSGERGRVNLEQAASLIGAASLRMASPREAMEITGFEVGSIPLVLQLPCILDRKLLSHEYIYGGAGKPGTTLKLRPHALETLNEVIAYLD
ncbi:YbaK/EbsC family protein [Paenibacillus sp. HN-1]|uniref:aminoacyl-tRNA deacylase n=1 Tax=Paenibacillus TaxID=44249 RepID=UPI001CA81225|nr:MULTISPECIES: YbaK/EbsC family protein [Paenibacillus]MBY9079671.1 YbaK/EbsC family protein [Paenibacillus sp. CGMCC 1.18879]MBY9082922.1 YbaK/EbsC family protein [Paenibacillus sinensis]